MNKVTHLLRTQRLSHGLYQKDLSALVPETSDDRISRVERGVRPVNAKEILAYPLIFGTLPADVFPGLVNETEEAVMRNAYKMHQALEGKTSPRATRTRQFLEGVLARAVDRLRLQEA